MPAILSVILGLLTGKAGEKIGGAVSTVTQIGAVLAAVAPVAMFLKNNKDDVFISVTYGELAFWSTVIAAIVIVTVRNVHRADPPS
jgi:hypothetical protein